MLIGIDANEANIENRVGVNQYAFDILWSIYRALSEAGGKKATSGKIDYPIKVEVYLKEKPLEDLPHETDFFTYKVLPGRALWIVTVLTPYLFFATKKPDVLFTPSHYSPPISPVPTVLTIHDLKYLEFPAQFKKITFWQLKYWTARSVNISKAIIAVSNSTKKEIVRHYPAAANKITVVYHGYDKKRFRTDIGRQEINRVKNKYSIVSDYVLFVGTIKPSKNVERIIEAFAKVAKKHEKLSLVIAGKKGWLYETVFKKAGNLGLSKRIVFTDFLPEEDKPALMAGAKLLVSPSLTEGFGMHAVEAMACGTPVLVSAIDAFEEVVADAGVFVNAESVEEIAGGVDRILKMPVSEYNRLVKKGVERAAEFSWKKAGKQTLEVIKNVVQ